MAFFPPVVFFELTHLGPFLFSIVLLNMVLKLCMLSYFMQMGIWTQGERELAHVYAFFFEEVRFESPILTPKSGFFTTTPCYDS